MNNALMPQAIQEIALGKNGTYSLSRDVLKHRVYDTRYFGATASDFTYYTQPEGSPWRVGIKSKNETNMLSNGKLPTSQTLLVKRMGIGLIVPVTPATENTHDLVQAFINLIQSSVFEIRIAGREYDYQIHGREFLPAIAVSGDLATNYPVRMGDMLASGWSSLDSTPIFIGNQISFNVFQKLDNPDTNVKTILDAASLLLQGAYATMQVTLEGAFTRAK